MPAKQANTEKASDGLASVANDCVYPLELFKQITGLDAWALRMARRNGLRVVTVGRRKFVKGNDFITYLDRLATAENATNGPSIPCSNE